MKALMTASALAALMVASPAFGQAQDQPQDPMLTEPPAASEPGGATTQPETMPAEPTPAPGAEAESQDAPDEAVASGDRFVTQQAEDEMLASTLIGTSVQNGAGETLGDIADVVLSEDGQAEVIVVGVGGFLGIGEKRIGVAFAEIEKSTDENGNAILMLNASAEELEAAPAFVTINELQQQQETEQPAAPAPDPMAPAAPEPAQ